MEILQILRNHVVTSPSPFAFDAQEFSTILDDVEKKLITLLEIHQNELHEDQHISRCINLEGLDGCGKSTLANELYHQLTERKQNVRLLCTPPQELLRFRTYFDTQTETIRRAYYNLGNLIVSLELKANPDTIHILDRYWPSTIAYQLARKTECDFMEISWPNYLVQPALIIYIHVDETERRRRISLRSIPVTQEEKQLEAQELFRHRLESIYRNRIPSTRLHVIDGNRPTSIMANDVLNLFHE